MGQISFANVSWLLGVGAGCAAPAASALASAEALVSGAALGAGAAALAAGAGAGVRAGALGPAAPALLAGAELEAAALLRGVLETVLTGAVGAVVVAGRWASSASELSLDPPQAAIAKTKPSRLPWAAREPRCSTPKN
jgi:hypothetical protein